MSQDFDLEALHAALDSERVALGMSWTDVGAALGMSASTLSGLGTRRRAEGDGVLRVVAWLGRSPESFVPGRPTCADEARLVRATAGVIRFDARALYAALESERSARELTWREVALACGVGSSGALTRLRDGGRVMFPGVMRVLTWLGAPAARFIREATPQ